MNPLPSHASHSRLFPSHPTFFLKAMVKQKSNLAAKVKGEQALRSFLPEISRQILDLPKTRGEITVKEIEEFIGANRNTSKVYLRKLAKDNYLASR